MPDMAKAPAGIGHSYKGKSEKDLEDGVLRALVFGDEQDGSRVICDCAVQRYPVDGLGGTAR
jgi:hypothetical protein